MIVIDKFSGEYEFLSNMYPCKVTYNGITYKCSEAAYQAQKQPEVAKAFMNVDGYAAKRMGKELKLRLDWEEVKFITMAKIVFQKFTQNKDLAEKLLNTGDAELIEGNWWGDTYWGICTNKKYDHVGENYLGKILMYVRSALSLNATKYREVIPTQPTLLKPFTNWEEVKPTTAIQYTERYEIKDITPINISSYIDDMVQRFFFEKATGMKLYDIELVGIPFVNTDWKLRCHCPKCNEVLDFKGTISKSKKKIITDMKFCQYCGQELNWNINHLL